ncbi:hypothetical protein JCM19992_32460 [Thermostilla marina]
MDADRTESAKLDARSATLDDPRQASEKLRAILMLGIFVVLPVLAATWPTVRQFVFAPVAGHDESPVATLPNEPLLAIESPSAPKDEATGNPFASELAEPSRVVAQSTSDVFPAGSLPAENTGSSPPQYAPYAQWPADSGNPRPIETAAVDSQPVAVPAFGEMPSNSVQPSNTIRPSAAPNTAMNEPTGTLAGGTPSLSPGMPFPASPGMSGSVGPAPTGGLPAIERPPLSPEQAQAAVAAIQQRLQSLGAMRYRLEPWGNAGQFYRFTCDVSIDGSAERLQHWESIDRDPVRAMQDVLSRVESWTAQVRRAGTWQR